MNSYGKLTDLISKEEFDIVGFDYNIFNINNYNINYNNCNINNIINNIINYNININNYNNNCNINNINIGVYYLQKTKVNSKILLVEFNKHDSFFCKVLKVVDAHKDYTIVFTKKINNLEVLKEVNEVNYEKTN